jgi:hypothetical protein
MNFPPNRVAWLGAEALRRLAGSPLSEQKRFLLGECVQAYLAMDEQQKQEYERLLASDSYAEVRAMNQTVYEQGIEKGQMRLVERLLEKRFGAVTPQAREYVEKLSSDELVQLAMRIPAASSTAELGLPVKEG